MTRTTGRAGASLAAALLLIVLAAAPAFACWIRHAPLPRRRHGT